MRCRPRRRENSMFSKILVANDGSPGGRKALEAAVELAKRISASLHMVMVEQLSLFPATIDEIEEEKDEADHRFAPIIEAAQAYAMSRGVAIETHFVPGQVAEAVVALVREQRFNLLVVGFMGHSQLYERIIGGTTDRLVRLAPCTVLVVK
jgi:nucleotide-binding universal stress UspA family protein